jgi:hypothetical protein
MPSSSFAKRTIGEPEDEKLDSFVVRVRDLRKRVLRRRETNVIAVRPARDLNDLARSSTDRRYELVRVEYRRAVFFDHDLLVVCRKTHLADRDTASRRKR